MKVLNPLWWYAGCKSGLEFAKVNPVGFGFTWSLSSVQTMWTTAFPASLAYPDWARDLATVVYPVVRDATVSSAMFLKEVVLTLWDIAWTSMGLGP